MRYYRPYMKILIWVIIGTFAMAGLDLIFPIVVRNLINQVLPAKDMQRLFIGSAVLLVLYIINFIIQFMVQYYGHVMSASIEHDMRRDLFSHIEKLSTDLICQCEILVFSRLLACLDQSLDLLI